MKPTKEQLADPKWWDENAKPEDKYCYQCERSGGYFFSNILEYGLPKYTVIADRPEPLTEPENETIFWVAKLDQYGTPWNTDGPHESYSKANEGCELLKQVNKKEKYIVTEMTFKKIKTQREELIEIIEANLEANVGLGDIAGVILAKYDLTEKDGE